MTQTPNLISLLSPSNIVVYILVLMRLTGMVQRAPFFSTIQAPMMTKLWFCAVVAFLLYPIVYVQRTFIIPHNVPELLILMIMEYFIGYLIAYIANMIIEGVRLTGNVMSIQMGLSMSQALDPVTGVQSPELSRIYIYLTTLIFLGTGAHQLLFVSVFNSFQALPMGAFPAFDSNIVITMCHMFASMFKIGFGIAFPIFAVLLAGDVLLGMMNKVMPQMNIYMVALPVKVYIGLFLALALMSTVAGYLQEIIENYMEVIVKLFTT